MMPHSIHDFPNTTVIGAHYLAGFSDMPSWTLIIDEHSRLSQSLYTFELVPKKARRAVIQLDDALVLEWIAQADRLDFTALLLLEQSICIDDSGTYSLVCHFGSLQKSITLRTLDYHVMQGHQEMIAFCVLWDAIHAHAPFPQTHRPWPNSQ